MARTVTTSKPSQRTGDTRHRSGDRPVPSPTWMLTLLTSSLLR